jgi:predicted extracellular nuclease
LINSSTGVTIACADCHADLHAVNERTTAPDALNGNLRIASFNVLNYFNGNGDGTWFRPAAPIRRPSLTASAPRSSLPCCPSTPMVGLMEIEKDNASIPPRPWLSKTW